MSIYICMMLLSIYISQHGEGLNFLDVCLLSSAAVIAIGLIITLFPPRNP